MMTTPPPSEPHKSVLAGSVLPVAAPAPPASKVHSAASARRTRERLVLISMALVTAAAAAALFALFDFSLPLAVLTGGLIWAALMTLHIQIKKSAEIAYLKSELARHDAARAVMRLEPDGGARPAPTAATPSERRAAKVGTADTSQTSPPDAAISEAIAQATSELPAGPQANPRWEHNTTPSLQPAPSHAQGLSSRRDAPPTASARPDAPPSGHQSGQSAAVETASWPGTSMSAADPMRDQWAFRPRAAQTAAHTHGEASDGQHAPQPLPSAGGSTTIDADLEMVQRKIKALADEVNAAELLRDRTPQPPSSPPQAAAIEKSIGALRAAAGSMRDRAAPRTNYLSEPASPPQTAQTVPSAPQRTAPATPAAPARSEGALPFDLMIPATAERIAVSDPSTPAPSSERALPPADDLDIPLPPLPALSMAPPPHNPRLDAIVAAIESGAMDVFLSPIVALQSHQVSHYDVTVRLKSAAGTYLEGADDDLQLAGSDVLALFDTARLKRSAALAQRLDAHSKPGSLLSPVNGPSITHAGFLETFARVYEERDRISNQLVLTFTQADVEQFSPSAWQALSDMNAFGFRFALSKIDHASMDFANLAARGFAFLRLDADALLKGLPARNRFVGPDELCKHLAGAGMTLVADTIDDEAVRARVFGFGILYGQGRLFGGARQVKLDPLPASSSAAA